MPRNLTPQQREQVRADLAKRERLLKEASRYTCAAIARRMGKSTNAIKQLKAGVTYNKSV